MKPSNPKFWTRDRAGQLEQRDLEREESLYRRKIFQSWREGIIDEPIVIYYEVYDCHGGNYIDDSLYQLGGCFIKQDDVVLDLGANIGIFTRFASDAGAKKIYSFEPIQENFELLMLNKPANAEAHRLAVSDVDNQAISMAYDPSSPGGSSFVHKYGEEQTVMSMTIDTMVNNGVIQQPDFIKMDIEGAEVHAFRGISDDILLKTRCIAMELHELSIGESGVAYIYNRLAGLGFTHFTLRNPDQCNIVWFTNTNIA